MHPPTSGTVHTGFPWLPEAQQLAYVAASAPAATAVAHVSAQSGEISAAAAAARILHFPAALPVNQSQLLDQSTGGNVMSGIYDPKAQQQDDPIAAAALHQGHRAIGAPPGTSESPQSLSQGSSGILGSFPVDPRAVSAEPASPPADGRRSEVVVGTSISVMLDDSQSGVPDSHRHPVLVTTQRGTFVETDSEVNSWNRPIQYVLASAFVCSLRPRQLQLHTADRQLWMDCYVHAVVSFSLLACEMGWCQVTTMQGFHIEDLRRLQFVI